MKIYLSCVIFVALALGILQQRKINLLSRELQNTPPLLESFSKGETVPELTAEQIAQMRAEHMELMRLRGSISELRAAAQAREGMVPEVRRGEASDAWIGQAGPSPQN